MENTYGKHNILHPRTNNKKRNNLHNWIDNRIYAMPDNTIRNFLYTNFIKQKQKGEIKTCQKTKK